MRSVKQEVQELGRFQEIVYILFGEGAGFILQKLRLTEHLPIHKKLRAKKQSKPEPQRLRETFEKLGTVFIKFGQILAQRPDLVPEKYCEELEKLEDDVESFSWREAEEIIEKEIGKERFGDIQKEPIASASIAQVHRAKLNSGEEVVIKVRRPGIVDQVEEDLRILNFLASEAEKHLSMMKDMEVLKFVKEFSRWTREETNLEKECMNGRVFRENLSKLEKVKVPRVYPDLTTERVLVMEYVEGVKCTEKKKLEQMEVDSEEIAEAAVEAGMRQSMLHGFFHADPHPSNFLIDQEGRIIYLDFGMMGKISKKKSEKLGLMLLYMIREDIDGMVDVLEDVGRKSEGYDREAVENRVEEKVLLIKNTTIQQHSITKEMFDLFAEISNHGLHMPSNLALMGKSLVTMEGIGLTICPDFKVTEKYEEMVEDILREKNSPEKLAEDFGIDLIKNKELFTKLPSKINGQFGSDGETKIEVTAGSQNLSRPLLVATLLIGASILLMENLSTEAALVLGFIELLIGTLLILKMLK